MKAIITPVFSHINLEKKKSQDKNWSKPLPLEQIIHSSPKKVSSYDALVMDMAQILHHNRNFTLYYRGQDKEYREKEKVVIYPSIYRKKAYEDRILLKNKFNLLNDKVEKLKNKFAYSEIKFVGRTLLNKFPEISWSILQHYEVCDTPLLDITHSLHVACSFAFDRNTNNTGIIYVFGFPFQTDALGYNSYKEMVNIRLLNVCPPQARRPFFQEGYLAGPFPNYQLDNSRRRNQFDFSRRLIAKFEIPIKDDFWGAGFSRIPQEKLYPPTDRINELCKDLR